ncbi:radical SAM protein [Psychrobacter sp. M13]|uniref:radical SAM protein n=1 Tax=Psychrobacter sp. M13 TaxID=3067275 RepID=UPI00273CB589|nr:radical SAM protein [Psychrobacter sp. M13]WLP94632.1 radical SAM protein [Psychrobacter sp. M13]
MKNIVAMPTTFIVKLTQICNINCSYCYVYNHQSEAHAQLPQFLLNDDVHRLGRDIAATRHIHSDVVRKVVFHGGEPLVAGRKRLQEYIDILRSYVPDITFSLQTNGILLSSDWIKFLKNEAISLSISIDGGKADHDQFRVDKRGRGTFNKVRRSIDLLHQTDMPFGLLCVVNPYASGADTYRALKALTPHNFNFLIPDVSRDTCDTYYPELPRLSIGHFLQEAFDLWLAEPEVVRVGLFSDMVAAVLGWKGRTDAFGSENLAYLIYETNGKYELLDVLKVCGSNMTQTSEDIDLLNLNENEQINTIIRSQRIIPTECRACRHAEVCRGGYLPHRWDQQREFDNPSVWCDDLIYIWDHVKRRVSDLARQIDDVSHTLSKSNLIPVYELY